MNTHTFGTFEAKNKLSRLLDLVENGDVIIITRNGKPVAQLVQPKKPDVEKATEVMRNIREMSKRAQPLGELTTRQLIEEGRRF